MHVSVICQCVLAGHCGHVLKPKAVRKEARRGRLSELLTSCIAVNSSQMAECVKGCYFFFFKGPLLSCFSGLYFFF